MAVATANWAVQFINKDSENVSMEYDKIEAMIDKTFPGRIVSKIKPSPVSGLYEILIPPNVYYTTLDGEYLLQGKLYNVKEKRNLTKQSLMSMEEEMAGFRLKQINSIQQDTMIIFPADKEKHSITVFTDIDCTFCRKLHSDIQKYNDLGITVRYLSFPRQPEGSKTFDKSVSVWCADDRRLAMTRAKQGKPIENRKCKNPVASHLAVGNQLGINSTPTIILPDGTALPGYQPAPHMLSILEGVSKKNSLAKKL